MRATGETAVRCTIFLDLETKFRPVCVALMFWFSAIIASPAQSFTTLVSFDGVNGSNPLHESLVQGADGSLYGTTAGGGANVGCGLSFGCGTFFKVTPTGALSTLYSFCAQNGCADGDVPSAGLVLATDGNLYGTTQGGGVNNAGTIFKITPTGMLTTLYSFCSQTNCADGETPNVRLVQARDGNFYGVTGYGGGAYDYGTFFRITAEGVFTTLYSFCSLSGCADGQQPSSLVQATDGNFYGTTAGGGTNLGCNGLTCGTVFKITPTGSLTTLYNFCAQSGCADGALPFGALLQATDGNFYGTTQFGGGNGFSNGYGTVFTMTPTGALTKLYSFCAQSNCTDGAFPEAGLVQATDGNFYGTTGGGGLDGAYGNDGTVFRITPTGTLTTLYSFCSQNNCSDGFNPNGELVQASDGNFYGTTYEGGTNNCEGGCGTIFSLTAPSYVLTVSRSGSGTVTSMDGGINCPGTCSHLYPANMPVVLNAQPASGWNFAGWSGACRGMGPCNITMTQAMSVTATFTQQTHLLTVSTMGSGTVTTMDHDINCPGVCGNYYPANTLVTLNAMAANGWTFAGWSGGGCSGTGSCNITMTQDRPVTASFNRNPNFFTLTVTTSGSGTVTSTPDMNINCPGTCSYTYVNNTQVMLNAVAGQGGMFSGWSGACTGTGPCNVNMTQNLTAMATFTAQQDLVTHSFGDPSHNDGKYPFGSLISDSIGNLYGTTSADGMYGKGTVFKVAPDGTETMLHNFGAPNTNDGETPLGNLIFDSAGNLYGTTSAGGIFGNGTVFELSPSGIETVLYNFANGSDGQNPGAGLISDSSGNLYGTTVHGGALGGGTVFDLSPNGPGSWTETVLYSFGSGGPSDGLNPYGGLIFDASGNLYGTTAHGGGTGCGGNGCGTVFELMLSLHGCCRENPVYSFHGADGANPFAGLVFDSFGDLFGTTSNGGGTGCGGNGCGTAFALTPDGGGGWIETFYSFGSNGPSDGAHPFSTLVFDNSGNLYGTAMNGGLYSHGTVFQLSPIGHGCCRENPVYSFEDGNDGQSPYAGLLFNAAGNLYGTTVKGGAFGGGTVFGLTPGSPAFVQLFLYPASMDFGVQGTNGPNRPQRATLTNNGIAPLHITSIAITGENNGDFFIEDNNCQFMLLHGDHCEITVAFSPIGSGRRNAELTITDSVRTSPQMVPVTGLALAGKVKPR